MPTPTLDQEIAQTQAEIERNHANFRRAGEEMIALDWRDYDQVFDRLAREREALTVQRRGLERRLDKLREG